MNNKIKKAPLMLEHQKGHSNKYVNKSYQKEGEDSRELLQKSDSWELPISLNEKELEPFPEGVFPKWLNDFIQAVSIESQTPIDAPVFATLATVSTVLNKKFDIKVRGNWKEYLNLYLTLALDSGNRKSSVFGQCTKPIFEYEEEKQKELAPIVASQEVRINAKEKRLTKLEGDYAKTPNDKILADMDSLSKEIFRDKEERIVIPKLTASDATPEQLAILMSEQNEKIALLSSEGAEVFEMIAGRYGERPNQDIYLKSFSSEPFDVERISRVGIYLAAPSIVIGLFVQSSVIQDIPNEFTNRGLTQRFLYSFPKDFLGYRDVRPEIVPEAIEKIYTTYVNTLLNLPDKKTRTLTLSKEALAYLVGEQKWVEKKLQDENINKGMIGWLSKLIGSIIRISGILHVIENIENIHSLGSEIQKETLQRAFLLRNYLISHAEKGFGMMGINEKEEDLTYLLERIKERCEKDQVREITYRDVFESAKSRFKTASTFKEKLLEIENLYWIHQYSEGRKSFISLNPNIPL